MRILSNANYDFVGSRNKAFIISGTLLVITFIALAVRGMNLSIDFVGGTVIQAKFEKVVGSDISKIRDVVSALNYGTPEIKTIGETGDELQIILKSDIKSGESTVGQEVQAALKKGYSENPFELRREELVGPKVGGELKGAAALAILLSLVGIVGYIAMRFQLPFGIAAIVALFHDVLITLGLFSIFGFELSLPIIGAILTIVGYSLNDTIVVFDRIRENVAGGSRVGKNFEEKVNSSINQCLSRTIVTSLTTLVVVMSILVLFMGSGDVLYNFSVALVCGIIAGTYSSVFVASPVLVMWNEKWPIK